MTEDVLSIQAPRLRAMAMKRFDFRPETGLPDMDSARFTAEQRYEVLIPQSARFGALIQDNLHLAHGRYEVEVPPLRHHVVILGLRMQRVTWEVSVAGQPRRMAPRADHLLVLPAGVDLRFVATQGAERLLHFHVGPDWLDGLAAEAGLAGGRAQVAVLTDARDPHISALFRRMERVLKEQPDCGRLLCEQAAVLGAVELLRLLSGPPRPDRHHIAPARLRAVKAHVEERLGEDVALAELAAVAQLSRFHFARAFRAETGLTPHGYVTVRRIERAKRMMLEGGLSLSEVALACGFAHQAHFTTAFRRSVGATPGRWRQERLS